MKFQKKYHMSISVINRSSIYSLAIFLILTFTVITVSFAYAETKSDEPSNSISPNTTLDVAFENIEGIGLYNRLSKGSFGKDIWKNSKRSSIIALLENMPTTSKTPEVNKMILSILLTSANTKLIENDIDPENGRDLLTLRLEKLIEGGAYKQAFELYSILEDEAYHERLARAGVLAMLYTGEKSLACLETNIVGKRFSDISFWTDLSAYCDFSLLNKDSKSSLKETSKKYISNSKILNKLSTNKDYRFTYTKKAYERLDVLERAILAAEDRLEIKNLKADALRKIPAAHIQPLLQLDTLSAQEKIILSIRGVELGLIAADELEMLYTKTTTPKNSNGSTNDTIKDNMPKEDWRKLAYLYNEAKRTIDHEEQWQLLRKALPLANKFGYTALIPYASIIQQIKTENTSLDEILSVYLILHRAGKNIHRNWINAYKRIKLNPNNTEKYAKLMVASHITKPSPKNIKENFDSVFDALQKQNPAQALLLQEILIKFDNGKHKAYSHKKVYEKDFYLTFKDNYVMQSGVVWDRSIESSRKGAIGETILLSIILLCNQDLQNIYPILFRDVLQNTENVGLTDVSRTLAISASLGKF